MINHSFENDVSLSLFFTPSSGFLFYVYTAVKSFWYCGTLFNSTFKFLMKTLNMKKTSACCELQQNGYRGVFTTHSDACVVSAAAGCRGSYVSLYKWFICCYIRKMPKENGCVHVHCWEMLANLNGSKHVYPSISNCLKRKPELFWCKDTFSSSLRTGWFVEKGTISGVLLWPVRFVLYPGVENEFTRKKDRMYCLFFWGWNAVQNPVPS